LKPLKVVAANDAFSALVALADVVAGKQALFVASTPTTDARAQAADADLSISLTPEAHNLPDEVDAAVALIVESSGSTGVPKRIEVELEPLLVSARASLEALGGPGQWLLALPVNFIAGIQVLVRSILADTQPVTLNTSVPFTAEGFARAASLMTADRRYTSLVPVQLNRLAEAAVSDEFVLEQLRRFDAILVGGQAPDAANLEKLRSLGVRLIVAYGMTETCGGSFYDGVALNGVTVEISPDGLIAIGGKVLANASFRPALVTNDLGELSADGRLTILGRSDRVINSGGLKLSLDAVEDWARTQPGITDAAAVAVEHEEFGQTFVCWVELSDSAIAVAHTDAPIRREAAVASLGRAASAATWLPIDSLPRLQNSKPDLQALQKLAAKLPATAKS
jgi:O-succinylbenzoic acid--CoA ligase